MGAAPAAVHVAAGRVEDAASDRGGGRGAVGFAILGRGQDILSPPHIYFLLLLWEIANENNT